MHRLNLLGANRGMTPAETVSHYLDGAPAYRPPSHVKINIRLWQFTLSFSVTAR